jgi:hypothetical protein
MNGAQHFKHDDKTTPSSSYNETPSNSINLPCDTQNVNGHPISGARDKDVSGVPGGSNTTTLENLPYKRC